ncbi:MAG: hypothetical protein JKY93_02200 [Gammaproteobacteria bacterium]|nr:hypothetical protein [Gammaproteobacteria bacterium]
MITSIKQAIAVQQRRQDSGKHGFAKAVRRFLKRSGDDYNRLKGQLSASWPVKKKAA